MVTRSIASANPQAGTHATPLRRDKGKRYRHWTPSWWRPQWVAQALTLAPPLMVAITKRLPAPDLLTPSRVAREVVVGLPTSATLDELKVFIDFPFRLTYRVNFKAIVQVHHLSSDIPRFLIDMYLVSATLPPPYFDRSNN